MVMLRGWACGNACGKIMVSIAIWGFGFPNPLKGSSQYLRSLEVSMVLSFVDWDDIDEALRI